MLTGFELLHGHEDARGKVDWFETGDNDRNAVLLSDGRIFVVAHHRADMTGGKESLNAVDRVRKDCAHCRRHEHVGWQDREVFNSGFLRAKDGAGDGRSGGFKADREEHNLLFGVFAGEFQGIERRIDHAYIRSLRAGGEEVRLIAGHAQHVAKSGKNHVRSGGNLERLFDRLEGGDADRTARTVDQGDLFWQELVESVLHDGMRLPAADLHDIPGLGGDAPNFSHDGFGQRSVPQFIQ